MTANDILIFRELASRNAPESKTDMIGKVAFYYYVQDMIQLIENYEKNNQKLPSPEVLQGYHELMMLQGVERLWKMAALETTAYGERVIQKHKVQCSKCSS